MSGYKQFEAGKNGVFIVLPSGRPNSWKRYRWYTPIRGDRENYGNWSFLKDGATPDNRVVENWFELLESWFNGERFGTKLRDAVDAVMQEEFITVKGRKAIVLLTDGKDYGSEVNEQTLMEGAAEADTLIYSVFYRSLPSWIDYDRQSPRGRRGRPEGWPERRLWMGRPDGIFTPAPLFPDPPQRPDGGGRRQRRADRIEERNEEAMDFLRRLSEVSAGRYYSSEVSDLKQTFGQIIEELRHQYRLGFYPLDHPAGSVHNIKVEVGIEAARTDVVVRSRRSYRVAGELQGEQEIRRRYQ